MYRAVREADNRPVVLKQLRADERKPAPCRGFCSVMKWATGSSTPALSGISRCWGGRSGEAGAATPPTLVLEDQGGWIYLPTSGTGQERLPGGRVLTIAVQLADALSLIHHQQVIHKDLHPAIFCLTLPPAWRRSLISAWPHFVPRATRPATAGAHRRRAGLYLAGTNRAHESGAGLSLRLLHPGLYLLPFARGAAAVCRQRCTRAGACAYC